MCWSVHVFIQLWHLPSRKQPSTPFALHRSVPEQRIDYNCRRSSLHRPRLYLINRILGAYAYLERWSRVHTWPGLPRITSEHGPQISLSDIFSWMHCRLCATIRSFCASCASPQSVFYSQRPPLCASGHLQSVRQRCVKGLLCPSTRQNMRISIGTTMYTGLAIRVLYTAFRRGSRSCLVGAKQHIRCLQLQGVDI